jgi:hypothetical protein
MTLTSAPKVARQFHTNVDFWSEKCYKQSPDAWKEAQGFRTLPRDEFGMTQGLG